VSLRGRGRCVFFRNSCCLACNLDRTIPDLSFEDNGQLWAKFEAAKRRLVAQLSGLGPAALLQRGGGPMTLAPRHSWSSSTHGFSSPACSTSSRAAWASPFFIRLCCHGPWLANCSSSTG